MGKRRDHQTLDRERCDEEHPTYSSERSRQINATHREGAEEKRPWHSPFLLLSSQPPCAKGAREICDWVCISQSATTEVKGQTEDTGHKTPGVSNDHFQISSKINMRQQNSPQPVRLGTTLSAWYSQPLPLTPKSPLQRLSHVYFVYLWCPERLEQNEYTSPFPEICALATIYPAHVSLDSQCHFHIIVSGSMFPVPRISFWFLWLWSCPSFSFSWLVGWFAFLRLWGSGWPGTLLISWDSLDPAFLLPWSWALELQVRTIMSDFSFGFLDSFLMFLSGLEPQT